MSLTYYLGPDGITYIPVTEADPLPVSGGGGGGDAVMSGTTGTGDVVPVLVTDEGRMSTDNQAMLLSLGSPLDVAWNGSDTNASIVAILKGMFLRQQQIATDTNEAVQDTGVMVALLNDIKTNTTPNG